MDSFLYCDGITGAVVGGDNHPRPYKDSLDQAYKQEDKRTAGGYRRKGFLAEEVSHDYGVCGVVQLLEEIPKGDGDGKTDDMPLYGSGCHQFCLSAHDKIL